MNKCKTRDLTVLSFNATNAICYLNFGRNAVFEYEQKENGMVTLRREHIEITIPFRSFTRVFDIIE